MGNAHAGSLRSRRRQYTNPMSKFVCPKTFQSDKSAKIFKILVKLGLYTNGVIREEKDSGFMPLTHLYS
jgi:hypothetical protein